MNKNDQSLWKYAGLATQFFVAIAIALFIGHKTDQWLKLKFPLAIWILPLLFIIAMIIKIIRDTSPKK